MAAQVEAYLAIVSRARDGRVKLPAFQRDWKWQTSQVILLFDSLRQGFPIGGFLFIKHNLSVDLSPREFRGAKQSAADAIAEFLVLDGQQRITAGLELFYGEGGTHYFLDLNRIYELFKERGINIDNTKEIRSFLADLEAEDKYCIARRASKDPEQKLLANHLLWTSLLTDEIEYDRALKKYKRKYPEREDFVDFVIGNNFRPSINTVIPITSIDDDVTVEGVSRIFSTLNSTGKMLTPFELVVSILYPQKVNLSLDVEVAREAYPYYGKLDASGDVLLQTIALFANKDTKKAALPKNIDAVIYRQHSEDALRYLNEAGRIMTDQIGLGLDQNSDLLVYPVIFSPMAFVLKMLSQKGLSVEAQALAHRKLVTWFIASVLVRRYQQSTHDKQARDKVEIMRWMEGGDSETPQWIKDAYIPNLKLSDPSSATGKLLRALMNANGLKDPYTNRSIGVGSGKQTSAVHHIFPTKFVKHLSGWDEKTDTNNLALNVMWLEQTTNASWLHNDPALQVASAIKVHGEHVTRDTYQAHAISGRALQILKKEKKNVQDFNDFLVERERQFVNILGQWGFVQPVRPSDTDPDEIVED